MTRISSSKKYLKNLILSCFPFLIILRKEIINICKERCNGINYIFKKENTVSGRNEIIDGHLARISTHGLVYTEVLGWIDLGHAQGDDIRNILRQMSAGESSNSKRNLGDYYDVKYSQGMLGMKRKVSISRMIKWRIKRGRHLHERYSIALAMMMRVARQFESMQASFPFNLVTDSGFSGEDLVSDLLGFIELFPSQVRSRYCAQ